MQPPSLAPAQTDKSAGRPFRLALGAGLLYDDNVVVEEIDDVSNGDDGGGVFELSSGEGSRRMSPCSIVPAARPS